MKRGFTIIELLVITAVICTLSAIVYPVFVAAKTSGIDQQSVERMGQLAQATLAYAADHDGVLPLDQVLRPDGSKRLGTGLAYPFPASSTRLGAFGALWNTPDRERMATAFWANSIFPYVNNTAAYTVFGIKNYKISTDDPSLGPLNKTIATINGELHKYPVSSIQNPAAVPLFWPGTGQLNLWGRSVGTPFLDCGGIVDDCLFNPNGAPSASGQSTFGGPSIGFGDNLTVEPTPFTWWIFGRNRMPMARADGSAAMVATGDVIFPNFSAPDTAFAFPFAQVADNGGPGPDPFNLEGTRYAYYVCNAAGVVDLPTPQNITYWCFFRPDSAAAPAAAHHTVLHP